MTSMGPESMPDSTATQSYPAPLSPMFIWGELKATRGEYDRKIDALSAKLELLDQHGSRGVDALRAELRQMRDDIEQHEKSHERQRLELVEERREQASGRRWLIGLLVALLVPLYPLLGYIVVRLVKG